MSELAINGPLGADASDAELIEELARARARIAQEIGKRVVGQGAVIEQLLIALFSRGHCLFVGVPGLAKTLLISTLAEALSLTFNRIQFTPDLMPSDITGTDVLEEDHTTGRRAFRFVPGPVFAHVLLADEINRTPPKTQAALLQAMQEHRVTAGGRTYPLEEPFLVFATQNPIEQEGTYPLPEAQLDRFMLSINIGYPSRAEERQIVNRTTQTNKVEIRPLLRARDIVWIQQLVRQMPVADHVVDYAVDLARATRPNEAESPDFIKKWLSWGAGPRAAQYLTLGAKALALLMGRAVVHCSDVRAVAHPVLRHRIFPNFTADAEGVDTEQIVTLLLKSVPEPSYGEAQRTEPPALPPRFAKAGTSDSPLNP
jgi:MoxR-like ATPase